MNAVLETLYLRRPKIDYVSPPVCDFVFNASASVSGSVETIMPGSGVGSFGEIIISSPESFNPDIIPGLVLWLNADAGIHLTDGLVTKWDDQSDFHNDFVAGVMGGVVYESDVFAPGRRNIKFEGGGGVISWLMRASGLVGMDGIAASIFAVTDITSSTGNAQIWLGNETVYWGVQDTGGFWESVYSNGVSPAKVSNDVTVNTRAVHTLTYDGVALPKFYVNNVQKTNYTWTGGTGGSGFNNQYANMVLGAFNLGSLFGAWHHRLGAILIYDRVVTTDERRTITDYLRTRYSV